MTDTAPEATQSEALDAVFDCARDLEHGDYRSARTAALLAASAYLLLATRLEGHTPKDAT